MRLVDKKGIKLIRDINIKEGIKDRGDEKGRKSKS